mgnify:CR=1 FL=1
MKSEQGVTVGSIGQLARLWASEKRSEGKSDGKPDTKLETKLETKLDCIYWPEIASTNDQAKSMSISAPELLLVTDHQTHGRGRFERVWESPPAGTALLSSWIFLLKHPPVPQITPKIGLAMWRAAKSVFPQGEWSLKAPNDLYLSNKKVAGVLVETITQGLQTKVIVGIGVNVMALPETTESATDFQSSLQLTREQMWPAMSDFLSYLLLGLRRTMQTANEALATHEQIALREALNSRSGLTEKLQRVGADGSLIFSEKTISWQDL